MIVKRHLLPVLEAEAAKRMNSGKAPDPSSETSEGPGKAAEQAAKAAGVGKTTVELAKAVNDGDPELADEVLAGSRQEERCPPPTPRSERIRSSGATGRRASIRI